MKPETANQAKQIPGTVTETESAATHARRLCELRCSGLDDSMSLRRSEAIGDILARLGLNPELEAAGRLLPLQRAGKLSSDDLEGAFPKEVLGLLHDTSRLPEVTAGERGMSPEQAEALREMLLAMARDIRVVVLHLADRLCELREAKHLTDERRRQLAEVTRLIYAPLANRLGMWQVKWELEDLALRYLDPETYRHIASLLRERRADREAYIAGVVRELHEQLEQAGIRAEIQGRPKHIFSIWKKMQRKGVSFDELFDVRAVRVLVDSVADCYAALGIVHGLWRHVPKEFDDYIANPKDNGYRSLHTAVFGPEDRALEIQIRTRDMHRESELGVAAHWRYKEGSGMDPALEQRVAWLRRLLEPADPEEVDTDLLDRFQSEVFEDRIYTLTPHGDIIDLPAGATPVDFAYHVHTEVGHRCRGAKVNGQIVPLNHPLNSGDRVEILAGKRSQPSRDWLVPRLGYVLSSRARSKIRHWFRQQGMEQAIEDGRAALDRELQRLGMPRLDRKALARQFKLQTEEEMLTAIGRGEITTDQIVRRLERDLKPRPSAEAALKARPARALQGGVQVEGVGDLATTMARCCRPVPGDNIIGFITRGRGVSVHRRDCRNLLRLVEDQNERLVEVSWAGRDSAQGDYAVDIEVEAIDRQGLLRDITVMMSNERANITDVETHTDRAAHTARIVMTVEIPDLECLSRLLHRLNQLPNITSARRRQS
jgi:GTP pyrophosphokinase